MHWAAIIRSKGSLAHPVAGMRVGQALAEGVVLFAHRRSLDQSVPRRHDPPFEAENGMMVCMDSSNGVMDAVLAVLDGAPEATHVHEVLIELNRASEQLAAWPEAGQSTPEESGSLLEVVVVVVVHLDALATAFMYDYFTPAARAADTFRGGGYRNRAGDQWPPPLKELPAKITSIWARYAAVASTPLARARLHDLLFEARRSDVGIHAARAAVEAYLECAAQVRDSPIAVCAVSWMKRALELSRATSQDKQLGRVTEQMLAQARLSVRSRRRAWRTSACSGSKWSWRFPPQCSSTSGVSR